MESPDYLPLSMLNQLEYCPRRFWLMHACGEMEVNAPVLEGTLQHRHAHHDGQESEGEAVIRRRVYVFSHRLHLAGFADVVEMRDGRMLPVEYKHGRMGRWLNDHVQLCAQALCLEEQAGTPASAAACPIPYGEIFYWGSRRRVRVEFTPELRARTEAAVALAFDLLSRGRMPAPIEHRAKCRDCSLQPVCLPDEVTLLAARAGGEGR